MSTLAAKWTRLPLLSAPSLHLSSHALAVIGTHAYIFGGELKPRTPVPAALTIVSLPVGKKLYLWGGRGGKDMGTFDDKEDVWSFDSENEQWTPLVTTGERPEQRSFHVLAACGDTLYLHAGCPPKGRLGTLHSLSLSTLVWTSHPSAPGPGRGGTVLAPLLHGTKLARYGGFAGFELGGPMDLFDVKSGEWEVGVEAGGEQPEVRSVHGLVGLDRLEMEKEDGGKVVGVMFMGEREGAPAELGHDGAGAFHADAWALTTAPNTGAFSWTKLTTSKTSSETPQARGWFASGAFGGDKVVVHGGLNERNERLDDMWLLEVVKE
ncbi:hypothetical protein RQP46_009673 [Phenoliferia psychrophenolica]